MITRDIIGQRIYRITQDEGVDLHVIGNLIRWVWALVREERNEAIEQAAQVLLNHGCSDCVDKIRALKELK